VGSSIWKSHRKNLRRTCILVKELDKIIAELYLVTMVRITAHLAGFNPKVGCSFDGHNFTPSFLLVRLRV
jgi:hypothetical protein